MDTPNNRRYAWYVVGMLWCVSLLNYADREAIFSLFPLLKQEMHLSAVELGLLGSSFAWVYGLSAPFAGNIVDRIRRKTAILGGLFAWSVIAVFTPLARAFRQLLPFMAADGLGETFYFPAAMSMIGDYHGPSTRSRAMGAHQTSVYLGTIAGGVFAGLIGEHYGWRWSYICFGGLGIGLGFILTWALREPARGAADNPHVAGGQLAPSRLPTREFLRIVWGAPTVLLLMGAFACANFVALVLLSWMPSFLYGKFHLNLALAGLSATIFAQLASAVGSPLGGWMADLLHRRWPGGRMMVQALAVLCGAPFVALCGWARSIEWVLVALSAWGLFKGLYDSNIFASLFDVIPPEARGTAAGFMNMVGWLGGGGIAPVAIGYIAERSTLGFAISLAASVYVAAGVLLLIGIFGFVKRDSTRMKLRLAANNK